MADIYLALGSNIGDRELNIETALKLLDKAFSAPRKALSPIINTEALGFEGPDFLNCIVVYNTRRRPATVLKICKMIEARMGRDDVPAYDENGQRIFHDRIIDIDILFYGNKVVNTPDLTIPHPQVKSRPYISELLETISLRNSSRELRRGVRVRRGKPGLRRPRAWRGGR